MFFIPRKMPAITAAVFLALCVFAVPAMAQEDDADYAGTQGFQGFVGRDANSPVMQAQPDPAPPMLPPVFSTVKESAAHEEAAAPPVADPCAEFTDSYDSYNVCQDRIKKIERMRDAKNRRLGIEPAPAPAPAPAAPTASDTAKQTTEKLEELEQKLKDKEAADNARRTAPTTKKGIGEFSRHPDKGNNLFR